MTSLPKYCWAVTIGLAVFVIQSGYAQRSQTEPESESQVFVGSRWHLLNSVIAKIFWHSNGTPLKKFGGIEFARGDDYDLTLDIYRPDDQQVYPAVVLLHGGGWIWGSKFNWSLHARRLAQQGFVVVAANYRLAPKFKFPAQVDDARQAVRWTKAHAKEFDLFPDQVAAFGYSAGGHLALLLATTHSPDEANSGPEALRGFDSKIQAVIAGGSPADFEWIPPDSGALVYWLGGTKRQSEEIYRKASPLANLDATDDCMFFLYHGEEDGLVPFASSQRFIMALQALGKPAMFMPLKFKGHLGAFLDTQIVDHSAKFLRMTFSER